jgi:LysR family transcriptional regulator, glycine cleavage system transcriptional activator
MALSHLRSLQALELALRMGSLQAAARALWITPAAAGQRIKALEEYLGVDLLVRGRSGLQPTPELVGALAHLQAGFRELDIAATVLNLQRSDEIHVGATSDMVDLWLLPRLESFKAEHPHILFCVNGEGEAPLRVGPVDCEITFGPRGEADDDVLFHDFVLPISSPENTRRIARTRLHDRLEGFPLLHLDFYKEDPQAPNWTAWIETNRLRRTAPDRGIRFQRIKPTLDAVLASAGLAICGLALLAGRIDDATLSLPFPLTTGAWTEHAFRARFRSAALCRPQVKAFREWLISQAADTRTWLARVAGSARAADNGRRAAKGRQRIPKAPQA